MSQTRPVFSGGDRVIRRRVYQESIDMLLFLSDEIEMQWLSARDGPSALRMAAALIALVRDVT